MMKKSSKGQGGEKHIFKSKVTIFNQILRIYIRKSLKLSVRIKDVISVGIRWGRKNADKMWLQGAGITSGCSGSADSGVEKGYWRSPDTTETNDAGGTRRRMLRIFL